MGVEEQNCGDLRTRVSTCLSKLSDRDTLPMAANELEIIARNLKKENFAPFLKCISATDSSEKSLVRRQQVRLLTVMSAAHGDALSPHLSRMISIVLRRLRDGDSAVRAACVEAVTSIATHVNTPPFSAMMKPLVDSLIHEQDSNAHLAAALCLSAAVEGSPEPDKEELRKLLPRVLKLVKCDSFKAKAALLAFITGIVNAGCVKTRSLTTSVVSTAVEFLTSEDWSVRKSAAELLEKAAVAGETLSPSQRIICLRALQSQRFDKVKLVRETMNRALVAWSHLLNQIEDDPSSPEVHRRLPESPPSSCSSSISSQKSTITTENATTPVSSDTKKHTNKHNYQDLADISVIRKQLLQIENQQSGLLVLIQNFMGRSQNTMSSLQKRVDGLEKMIDEISRRRSNIRVAWCQGQNF